MGENEVVTCAEGLDGSAEGVNVCAAGMAGWCARELVGCATGVAGKDTGCATSLSTPGVLLGFPLE